MKTRTSCHDRRRGSVLLLVVITMTILSLFAVGATSNSSTMVETAAAERDMLDARIAADSAIVHANRRLFLDNDYAGTGGWVAMETGAEFRTWQIPGIPVPGEPAFYVEARAGDAQMRLVATYEIGRNDSPYLEDAIALLGGDADFNNVQVNGDLLIVDTEGGVMDYDPNTNYWYERDSGGDPQILSNNTSIDGDLGNYTGSSTGIDYTGEMEVLERPVSVPAWDLDQYILGGPGVDVIYGAGNMNIRNMNTNNTVVIVAEPGTHIDFKRCNIKGGVVIWAPSDYPQRGEPRNTVDWSSCVFGSPDSGSGYENIGMLAPATQMRHGNHDNNEGYGLFHYHSINHLNNSSIEGALWVTNEVNQLNGVDVTWNPELAEAFFQGMQAGPKPVEVLSVSEFHPEGILTQ